MNIFKFKCLNLASVQSSATHANWRENICVLLSHRVQGLEFVGKCPHWLIEHLLFNEV